MTQSIRSLIQLVISHRVLAAGYGMALQDTPHLFSKVMQGFVERVIAPRIVPLDQDLLLL